MKVKQLSDSQGLSYLHLVMLSLYAILLGVLVGLIDAVFGRVLIGLSEYRDQHIFYLVPALPLAGLLIVYLYQKLAGKAAQGMGLIFKVGHNEEDQVPLRLIPLVTVTFRACSVNWLVTRITLSLLYLSDLILPIKKHLGNSYLIHFFKEIITLFSGRTMTKRLNFSKIEGKLTKRNR